MPPCEQVFRLCNGSQSFDDTPLANCAMATLSNHEFQFPAQHREVGKLLLHLRQMFPSDNVHGFAGLFFFVGEIEQRSNLLNRKTKVARSPREGKAADMSGCVVAVITRGARRMR